MIIPITAAVSSGNEIIFNIIDTDGIPVNLTNLGTTVVTVEVCGPLIQCGSVKIDSNSNNVSFQNDIIKVKFGMLNLKPSNQLYFPKVSYITDLNNEAQVIAGKGYRTEIRLKMIC